MTSKHDVVVIGAGLAGLQTALLLEDAGLDVRVVEAKPRIGGRIHSMRQLGTNAEAGGTFIGAGYRRLFAVADRFAVRLIDVTPLLEFFREQDLCLGTEIIRQADWPTHPANPFPEKDKSLLPWNYHRVLTMRENPLEAPEDWAKPAFSKFDISLHDWMRSLGLSDDVVRMGYNINSSFGADAHDVSALLMFFRAAFSKAQRVHAPKDSIGFTVENGVQSITDAMASGLKHEILLEHVVTEIDEAAMRSRVTCANGSTFECDRVVCAVPFGALKHIVITPPLSNDQARGVAELPSQALTQVYLAPKTEFWRRDGYAPSLFTDSGAGMIAAVRDGADPTRITHLTAWVMGPQAERLDRMTDDAAGQRVIAEIERIRPAARGQLECIGLKSWGADPYSCGAWAYFRPGQIRAFAARMGQSRGQIHFCGEHLGGSSRGIEGALESAEQVAADILAL